MTRTARIVCLLAAPAIVAAIASTAYGHARLMTPTPRDSRDGYKDMTPPGTGAPCGIARTASQPSSNLTAGATLNLAWEETIDHPGCFVVDFAAANDQNFQVIGRKSHANPPAKTGSPATRKYTMSVTLPSAPCTACTLRLRQLMLTADVAEANLATACPPATVPANVTYYSCANVVLGGGTGGSGGGAGGTAGTAGGGGNAGGGRGGSAAGGRGGGAGGASGAGQAGTSGQAGDNGQAGTSGQAGSGSSGQAGTSGQAGSGSSGEAGTSGQAGSGSSGQAGTSGQAGSGSSGQAGNGSSGAAGSSPAGTGGSYGDGGGGCQIGGGITPAPLGLLLAVALIRRRRRRSRS